MRKFEPTLLPERYNDRPEERERAKKIFNIIVDKIGNVSPWLAKRMRDLFQ